MTNKQKNLANKQKNLARIQTKKFKGVYFDATAADKNSPKVFRTILYLNGLKYSAGYHATAEEAAKAYNKKAKSLLRTEKAAKLKGRWNVIGA